MATVPVSATLVARVYGKDFDLGEMILDAPVSRAPGPGSSAPINVGDIKPALADALRQAADAIESNQA